MEEYGLALCGGGGKGAYHMGVWKALEKIGLASKITAVSGTSVGALNAVLFALGDFEKARDIWLRIGKSDFWKSRESDEGGVLSRKWLEDIMNSLDLTSLTERFPVLINCYNKTLGMIENFKINDMPTEDMKKILLASSAMMFVYSNVEINGDCYTDAGSIKSGNVPVEPLCKMGCRNIIVVSLDFNLNAYKVVSDAERRYPDVKFIVLKPMRFTGYTFPDMMDFSKAGVLKRMAHGYSDTMKQLDQNRSSDMDNKYTSLNFQIRKKMEELFHSREELEQFIETANIGEINVKTKTLGGEFFYNNIVELFGWKVQQHNVSPMKFHYRILDNENVRRAWFTDPEELMAALEEYEAAKELGLI